MIWRTGVTRRGPLCDKETQGGKRRFAFTLLEDLERSFQGERDEALLARIYNQLVVGEKIYKTTRRGRFKDLDARLADEVAQRMPHVRPVRIHDVGASSGVTSLELQLLFDGRHPVEVHATDFYDRLVAVKPRASVWTVVFDVDGEALQFVSGSFVLSAQEGESRKLPINRALAARAKQRVLLRAQALRDAVQHQNGEGVVQLDDGEVRVIRLVHPDVADLLNSHSGFTFGRHDVFEPTPTTYDVVRAVNVLNPGYFDDDRVRSASLAVAKSLRSEGLFLVGRTIDEEQRQNRATLFLKTEDRFLPLWDHQGGAENREVVLSLQW
ncbi:MAG: hypothetical protein V3W41_11930 [Planctomycetota bacterium]